MQRLFMILLGLLCLATNAQQTSIDSRYFEDQFYLGISYNTLLNTPSLFDQKKISYGLGGGFIKDLPINSDSTMAFGVGLGYAINQYSNNLGASQENQQAIFIISNNQTNQWATHLIEFPIEFRWRTSTADTYKFWRIYTGGKIGYVFANTFNNSLLNKFQYGLQLSAGYNTWNFYFYYGLRNLFKKDIIMVDTLEKAQANELKIGLMFYIL